MDNPALTVTKPIKYRDDARARIATFLNAFDKEPNATKAALAAGYSPRTAMSQGARLLGRPDVKAELTRRRAAREMRTTITVDDTVMRLATIARCDVRRAFTPNGYLLHPHEWPDDLAFCVAAVDVVTRRTGEKDDEGRPVIERTTKIKLEPRKPALDSIMRHLGGFDGRRNSEGNDDTAKPALSELEFAKMICFLFEELKRKGATIDAELIAEGEVRHHGAVRSDDSTASGSSRPPQPSPAGASSNGGDQA